MVLTVKEYCSVPDHPQKLVFSSLGSSKALNFPPHNKFKKQTSSAALAFVANALLFADGGDAGKANITRKGSS